ncbi:MAG: MlaD family protein [Propionibacteriales bacterium]|nr:MlaD family protein [Propionibacteriales bacterium]
MSTRRKPSVPLHLSSARIGVVILVVTLLVSVALFNKDRINSMLLGGDKVEVHFDRAYKLRAHVSQVKVAFVVVGKVVAVRSEGDDAVVELKVESDVLESLGSEPSATIRPTTLLGGSYFVDLQPGGDPGAFTAGSIPVERTAVPVELDKVARALQPNARAGLQGTVRNLDEALDEEGERALRDLVDAAPAALDPAAEVLDAAQGLHPNRDLTDLTSGMENLGRVLSRKDGQLDQILTDLQSASGVLDNRSSDVATAVDTLPDALDSTRTGLADLSGSLDTLRDVSADTRPLVRQLDKTLGVAGPVVKDARPLVADLRSLMSDARPVVNALVPTSESADAVLTDLEGKVLDRVDKDVMPWLHAKYVGKGPYQRTSGAKPTYQELAYMFATLDRASGQVDKNGHAVGFQPGIGSGSVGGIPISLEQMFKILTEAFYLPQPVDTLPPVSGGGGTPSNTLDNLLSGLLGGGR